MAKDPNFVSVRLPDDVAELLRAYATDKKLVRAGNPNMGGSIIAILRAALQGQTNSNNVGQSSDLDESLIDRIDYLERANRVGQKEVDERFDEFDEHYCKLLNQHKENIGEKIAALVARLEALEANRTEATETEKKPLMLSQNQKVIAMQKLQDTA
jgi:hypothetical protein